MVSDRTETDMETDTPHNLQKQTRQESPGHTHRDWRLMQHMPRHAMVQGRRLKPNMKIQAIPIGSQYN